MVKIDIVDIIEGLYNVENSNTFIENYLKNESMFDTENPANKRVREVDESFSQYSNNYPQNDCGNVDNLKKRLKYHVFIIPQMGDKW